MKKVLKDIKTDYNELNVELEKVNEEEIKAEEVCEKLSLDYKACDEVFNSACDHFRKIENRIKKRKEEFASKKCSRQVSIVGFGTAAISLVIAFINTKLGLITQPFYAYVGAALLGCMASIIDMQLFWDKTKEKGYVEFEELESTKSTRDVSDKAYVEKLKAEKELREVQGKLIEHTKVLNEIKRRKNKIENKIRDIKINTFDKIMNCDSQELDGQSLVLK